MSYPYPLIFVTGPTLVAANLPVSPWSTTPWTLPRNSSPSSDWWDKELWRRPPRSPESRRRKGRTEWRRSEVPRRPRSEPLERRWDEKHAVGSGFFLVLKLEQQFCHDLEAWRNSIRFHTCIKMAVNNVLGEYGYVHLFLCNLGMNGFQMYLWNFQGR